jgi:KDO2-lipid IV(A) lauroyltransferase
MSRVDQLNYWLQAVGARAGMGLFGALPLDVASRFGGILARKIGPMTGAHKTAIRNLAHAFPNKTTAEREAIAIAMWDNIGRTIAEYPHLGKLTHDPSRVAISDPQHAALQLAEDGVGGLLIGMHAGNWELSAVPGLRAGLGAAFLPRAEQPLRGYDADQIPQRHWQGGLHPQRCCGRQAGPEIAEIRRAYRYVGGPEAG